MFHFSELLPLWQIRVVISARAGALRRTIREAARHRGRDPQLRTVPRALMYCFGNGSYSEFIWESGGWGVLNPVHALVLWAFEALWSAARSTSREDITAAGHGNRFGADTFYASFIKFA
ncbi:hypothetical protein EVAR_26891_1 [Eumeta japonica]|uniref:Uncharacterized protein n=1 Tax=Eumeta variegata TaxID=151549 RepID=A0A4C1VUD0_EUMVA|nr:hypothetical protein EVAR_26891_1 [Eumeta japonica]